MKKCLKCDKIYDDSWGVCLICSEKLIDCVESQAVDGLTQAQRNDNKIQEEGWVETSKLYNKGKYAEALEGFKKLSNYNENSRIYFLPFIERCEKILAKKMSKEDIEHKNNQYVAEHFDWVNKIGVGTGIIAFISLMRGGFWGVILAVTFGAITFFLYSKMKKFNQSKGLVRCKYCGRYTRYIDPNEPTMGFASTNNCEHCGRMYPMPTMQWDCWGGLEYIEGRHSVPEKEFYDEYNNLKEKYPKEYKLLSDESEEK